MTKPNESLFWKITHRNALGWPDERKHMFTGKRQHRVGGVGKWVDGPLPEIMRGFG